MHCAKFDIVNGKTIPLFLRYTIPNVLSIIALSSAQLIDAFFIGNFSGSVSLASINIVIPAFSFVFGLGIMLCTGGSVLCAKAIGEKNLEDASNIFSKIVMSIFAICMFMTCLGVLFSVPFVKILGANQELVPESSTYLFYVSLFFCFFLGSYCLSVFSRVVQRPMLAFAAMLSGAFVNIFLDWLFIYKFGWGVKGAAIGTGIAHLTTFLILLRFFISKECPLKLRFKNVGSWKDILSASYNGFSELANELSIGITTLIFNWIMISNLGTIGVAAYTVINYALFIGTMLFYGIGDSIVPLISTNYGAQKVNRIKCFLRTSILSGFSIGVFIFAILMFFPQYLVDFFLNDNETATKELALQFIFLLKWAFLFSSVSIILSAYFTAIEKPLESVIVAVSRSLFFPTIFLLSMPHFFNENGIFISIPLAEFTTICIALFLWTRNRPHRIKERF